MMFGSRAGLKALGLCVLVVGVVALSVSNARTEVGASWKVVEPPSGFPFQAAIENEEAALLTTLVGTSVKVLCKTVELSKVELQEEGSLGEGGKAMFSHCETFLNGVLAAACIPQIAGVKEVIETKEISGLLVLVGGVGEMLIKAGSGTTLAEITSTEKCAVGEKIKIEGEFFLKDCKGMSEVDEVVHLVEVDNASGTLTANKKAATLDGSLNVSLANEGTGLKWSGTPG